MFTRNQHHRSARAFILLVVFLVIGLAVPANATDPNQNELVLKRQHNAERVERGIPRLRLDEELITFARRHSRQMYRSGHLFHTENLLSSLLGIVGGLISELVGENVAVGPSIRWAHEAFMDSPRHRENILNRAYDVFGIGAIQRDGDVWVTVVFVG